jgi:hypothetical protein
VCLALAGVWRSPVADLALAAPDGALRPECDWLGGALRPRAPAGGTLPGLTREGHHDWGYAERWRFRPPLDPRAELQVTGHVLNGYLGQDATSKAVTALTHLAARWREGLVIIEDDPLHARVRASGWLLDVAAEPESPHRLIRPEPAGRFHRS